VRWRVERGSAHLEPATWHPRFGVSIPNTCLVVALEDGQAKVLFEWVG
jgi:hypothetical protein